MLYGHHPFLSHADMELGEAEQVVQLIENEVKGQLHFPQGAEPSVCDLLRRILVPAPAQRFTISSIMNHAWFQVGASAAMGVRRCLGACSATPNTCAKRTKLQPCLSVLHLPCLRTMPTQKKLPPGALDLNSSYLQATSYHVGAGRLHGVQCAPGRQGWHLQGC